MFYPPAEFGSHQDVRAFVGAMLGQTEGPSAIPAIEVGKIGPEVSEPPPEPKEDSNKASLGPAKSKDDSQPPPKVPSTPAELEMAMFWAFFEKRLDDAEKRFAELMAVEKEASKRSEHEVWHAYLQYSYGKLQKGLDDLRRFSEEAETQSQACFYLGWLYEELKEFDKAIDAYEKSAETAPTDIKPSRIAKLAAANVAAGRAKVAHSILMTALDVVSEPKQRAVLYEAMAATFESENNDEMRAVAFELAIDCDPYNADLRFNAAFAYSKFGLRDLALFHYTAQVNAKPDDIRSLNNLGVECQNFGMPIASVRYYRRAFKEKHTLAGANLAYLFMNAGFFDEAKTILNEAKDTTEPHPNVGTALAALSQKNETEDEQTRKILERALSEQAFIKEFGKSRLVRSPDGFAGAWKNIRGETFEIARVDSKLTATWMVGKNKNELSGTVENRGAKITLRITPENVLLIGSKQLTGYAYTSLDSEKLHWMLFEDRVPQFDEFARAQIG